MCSPKIPKPDPAIGEAAKQNADIAASMRDIAKDQLDWERERADKQDPLVEKIVNQQISQGDVNADRATEQWNIYKNLFQPMEQRMVDDANNFDSQERKDRMAGSAAADVTQAYANTADQNMRNMGRLGVNPNSGRFDAVQKETNLSQAKDTAGAMNQARTNTELQGMAMRQGAAQFGRNMPSTGLAADSTALNAGNSAVNNMNASNAARNASMASAQGWFGGALSGNNSAGGLMNNLYGNQLNAWNMQNQNNMAGLQGLGSLAGTLGAASILKGGGAAAGGAAAGEAGLSALAFLRTGGVIKNNHAYGLSSLPYVNGPVRSKSPGGLGTPTRKGYAEGGMIEGPGTGTSDSIPASIEGVQPIKLSNGEAVLNTGAVELLGEDAIHRLNAGGLMMLEKNRGNSANSVSPGGLGMSANQSLH